MFILNKNRDEAHQHLLSELPKEVFIVFPDSFRLYGVNKEVEADEFKV